MPTYEYHCDACDHNFDEFQAMSDKPLKKCPQCRKSKLRRVFGAGAAILFKGSGFYQTDYRSDSYKAAAKAEQGEAKPTTDKAGNNGASGSGDGGKSANEAKPAKKSSKSSAQASDD